jgi:protein-arginine kinase activator protein McsA
MPAHIPSGGEKYRPEERLSTCESCATTAKMGRYRRHGGRVLCVECYRRLTVGANTETETETEGRP